MQVTELTLHAPMTASALADALATAASMLMAEDGGTLKFAADGTLPSAYTMTEDGELVVDSELAGPVALTVRLG